MARLSLFHSPLILASVVFVLASLPRGAGSDSIKLDSGKTLEGSVVSENPQSVQIKVGDMTLTFPRSRVAAIVRTAPAEPTSGTAPLEQLQALEARGLWPELYEAAARLLVQDTSNTEVAKRQKLAADKIRESLGGRSMAELARRRKFEDAITTLTERLQRSNLYTRPAGAVGRRMLAELYVGSADFRLAQSLDGHAPLAEARKARELDPATPGLDAVEARAQMQLRDFDLAIPLLERALRAEPGNFTVRLLLLRCYREKNDFDRIVRTFEDAPPAGKADAESWPEARQVLDEAFTQKAIRLAEQGDKPAAAAAFETGLRFSPRTADRLRDAAAFFERVGDTERARKVRGERPANPYGATPPTSATLGTLPRPR